MNACLCVVILMGAQNTNRACSMYKITLPDRTIVGCNEDAWRITPHIWFEQAGEEMPYGAAFTGSRFDGPNGYAPQSGMNTEGLVYSRLASHNPGVPENYSFPEKTISNPTQFLKSVLHQCKNVDEVFDLIKQYNHSIFFEDVIIYTDRSGKYLIMEPYLLTMGSDANYVLSNFCPSVVSEEQKMELTRYRNGIEYLQTFKDTSFSFFRNLSEAMHVNREKANDGTLLTSIWDNNAGEVTLFFYHNYKDSVRFVLNDELNKGNRLLSIESLFPFNENFEKLKHYKTPYNTKWIMAFIMISGCFFFVSSAYFMFLLYSKRRQNYAYKWLLIGMVPFTMVMFWYMFVLCTNIGIYYFPAPFTDSHKPWVSASSYIPIVLISVILPLLFFNFKILQIKKWNAFPAGMLTLNVLSYVTLTVLFFYWELIGI